MSRIYSRSRWTATEAGGEDQTVHNGILFVHHTVSNGKGLTTLKKQAAALNAIRRHHVYGNGWEDIGYNYLVIQPSFPRVRARVFVGRGKGKVPASQEGYNRGNLSVAVLSNNDKVKRSTLRALKSLARQLPVKTAMPHNAVNSTSCPGSRLHALIPQIRKAARR